MELTWVIAGGGTGGHVTLGLALAEVIQQRGDRAIFIGSDRSLEARLVPEAGFELIPLPSSQVMGRSLLGRLQGVLGILRLLVRARRELGRAKADIVISVGGYAAMPAVLAAVTRRTAIAVVEPNAIPGRANRLAGRFAKRVFLGFERARPFFHGSSDRVQCVGVPLRQRLISSLAERSADRTPTAPYHLFVFGGSQGAKQINDAVVQALPRLREMPLQIFHQVGEADLERVRKAFEQAGVDGEVVPFESDMPSRYAWADLAVCRAGALTLAELALAGLPALLVPYPYAADDHQTANVLELEKAGAAKPLAGLRKTGDEGDPESDTSGEQLADAVAELLAEPQRLTQMRDAARRWAKPEAARTIVDDCARLLGAGKDRLGAGAA